MRVAFTGQVSGLAGSDAIDLADVSYGAGTTATFLGNTTGGTLTITDGTQTANIALVRATTCRPAGRCRATAMAAPLSLIRCRPTPGKRFLLAPAASSMVSALLTMAPWWCAPIRMAPISGMGRSGSSSLRQRACRPTSWRMRSSTIRASWNSRLRRAIRASCTWFMLCTSRILIRLWRECTRVPMKARPGR